MTTYIAASLTLFLVAIIAGLLERTHRREAGMPHAPLGADPSADTDLQRVLHDLGARS
jgi:hypothetical protein